jgi:hypothetical protein
VPPPTYLTSCTPTKSNLYLDSSLEIVIRKPALFKLLTFHNPNLMSVFHRLGRFSRESVQVRSSLMTFVRNYFFYGEGLLAPRPTPKLEDYSLFSAAAYSIYSQLPSIAGGRYSIHNPRTCHAMVTGKPRTKMSADFIGHLMAECP